MAKTSPPEFDVGVLRGKVQETYQRLAQDPAGEFHFNHGIDYACELLQYDRAELESLPEECTRRFAGLGNPHRIGPIGSGETVLDIGCGAGLDMLLSARRTGAGGKVIGIEPTSAMREMAAANARQAALAEIIEIRDGTADSLPVEDASIDVVQSNGVINLTSDKTLAFREISRVLKPGGRLHLADVVIDEELSLRARSDELLWAA